MINRKDYFDIVFVVLVYRNIDVLRDFFTSLKLPYTYKVIVVNSYFDEATEKECQQVAEENNAVFISVPNNGYSSGNNSGCDYAIEHYGYKYLIVSNSDIIINDISYLSETSYDTAVIAPETKMLNGHKQNPNIPFRNVVYMILTRLAYKYEKPGLKKMALIFNRFCRELMLLYISIARQDNVRIFSPHGSFIVFTKRASQILQPIFNDKMFLYNEETYLGYKCKKIGVPVYYSLKLKITHLEGASSTESSNSWKNKKASFAVLLDWLKENDVKI